jgi:hypothetical protein
MLHVVIMSLLLLKRMELLQQDDAGARGPRRAPRARDARAEHGVPSLCRRDDFLLARVSTNMSSFISICSCFLENTLRTKMFNSDVLFGLVEAVSIRTITAGTAAAAARDRRCRYRRRATTNRLCPAHARAAHRQMQRRGRRLAHMARLALAHAHHADGRRGRPTPGLTSPTAMTGSGRAVRAIEPPVPSPSGLVEHDGANNEYVAGGGGPPAHDQGRRARYLLRRDDAPHHPHTRARTARAPHARHTRAAHAHRPTTHTHTPLRLTLARGAPRAQTGVNPTSPTGSDVTGVSKRQLA